MLALPKRSLSWQRKYVRFTERIDYGKQQLGSWVWMHCGLAELGGRVNSVSFSAACCILELLPLSSPHSPFHQEWVNSWRERSALGASESRGLGRICDGVSKPRVGLPLSLGAYGVLPKGRLSPGEKNKKSWTSEAGGEFCNIGGTAVHRWKTWFLCFFLHSWCPVKPSVPCLTIIPG